jgi:hypothetical protein
MKSILKKIIVQSSINNDCTIDLRNRRESDDLQEAQRDRQTQGATAALQVCISCSFFKFYIYIGVSERKVDTKAVQRDIVRIFKGFVNPPILLFVIAFDFERLRIYQDIFFDWYGSPMLYRNGSLVPLLPCVMCRQCDVPLYEKSLPIPSMA